MLRADRAVLLLIDLQERPLREIPEREMLLRNTRLVARAASLLEVPVVLTTQDRRAQGDLVPEVTVAVPAGVPVDKVTFGCFRNEAFVARLYEHPSRDQLLVAGIETHIAICQTVLGALEKSYAPHVLSDAVGSGLEADHQVGLARMQRAGALVSSTEMALYELLGRSDTQAFEELRPLLKRSGP
jgi:isochorismate hydrolase